MQMVIVACVVEGCDHGVCYVTPDDQITTRYRGGHRPAGGGIHRQIRTLHADYDGDPTDSKALMAWANDVLAKEDA